MGDIIQFPDHDFIKLVDGWGETKYGPNMAWIDTSSIHAIEKIARAHGVPETFIPPPLRQKIAEIEGKLPRDKVAFYNRALGAFESYGINKNGDCWYQNELVRKHATFTSDGRYFRHHQNKAGVDPDFGRPIASAFNDKTQMVDLIILADLDKQAEEDIQSLERGDSIWTSMGCRVKHDVCLVCGNQAKHRGLYCEHVKEGAVYPFGMGQVLSDGRVCGVSNPDPVFFDISRVRNPAFVGSENLAKVAGAKGGVIVVSSAARAERAGLTKKVTSEKPVPKTASASDKLADMIKEVPMMAASDATTPDASKLDAMARAAEYLCATGKKLSKDKIKSMVKKAGSDSICATSAALGIVLSPDEFGAMLPGDLVVETPTPEAILRAMSTPVAKTAALALVSHVDHSVAKELAPLCADRSFLQPFLVNALLKAAKAKPAPKCTCASPSSYCGAMGCRGHKITNKVASDAYLAYRAGLMLVADDVGNDAVVEAMKVAETTRRYVTKLGAAFALLAFCRTEAKNSDGSVSQILAKQSSVADTLPGTMCVSGTMADDFGEEVMEKMADNSLQSFHRSR